MPLNMLNYGRKKDSYSLNLAASPATPQQIVKVPRNETFAGGNGIDLSTKGVTTIQDMTRHILVLHLLGTYPDSHRN